MSRSTKPPEEELTTETTETIETTETSDTPVTKEAVEGGVTRPEKGSAEWYAEKVPIRLFKDGGKYKEDVFVAVNGKGYLIQRGIEVMVPRFVAEVLNQSMDQDAFAAEYMEREQATFEAETRRLGIDN